MGYQELAENGYMLLAERLREPHERTVVQQVLGEVMRVKVRPTFLSNLEVSLEGTIDLLRPHLMAV